MHRELWWKGNTANFPTTFIKGHFESSLCGGMSPGHGESPSTQLMGVTDCCRQHRLSSPISWVRNPDIKSVFGPGSRDFVGYYEDGGRSGLSAGEGTSLELWLQGCRV